MLASVLLAIVLFSGTGVPQPSSQEQELQRKLQTRVEEYTVSEETFVQALARVAAEFELPMGIEWIRSPRTLRKVHIPLRRANVYQVIDSLVKSQRGYDWQIENGVVHIFPEDFKSEKRNFLNLIIDNFEVKDEFVGIASYELRLRLRLIVSPPHPRPGEGSAASISTGMGDRKVNFRLERMTVREILNKFISVAGFRVWVVTFSDSPTPTESGFRQVVAARGTILPENEQPAWLIMLWGSDPLLGGPRSDWRFRPPTTKLE